MNKNITITLLLLFIAWVWVKPIIETWHYMYYESTAHLPPELNHGRRQGSLYNSDEEELGEYIKLKVITPIINRSKR